MRTALLASVFLASLALTLALGPLPQLTQLADYPRPAQKDASATKRGDNPPSPQGEPAPTHALIAEPEPGKLQSERDFEKTDRGQQRQNGGHDHGLPGWLAALVTLTNTASAAAVALFTFFLVRFGARQAHATKKSVDAMNESTQIALDALTHARNANAEAERPWVGPNRFTLLEFKVGQAMETEVRIKNFGRTPAVGFTTWGGSDLMPTLGQPSMNPRDQSGPHILFPTQVVRYLHKPPEVLSADQFQAIQNGELYFVVAGRLTYKDQLGRECVTEYCGFYEPHSRGFQMVAGLNRAT